MQMRQVYSNTHVRSDDDVAGETNHNLKITEYVSQLLKHNSYK